MNIACEDDGLVLSEVYSGIGIRTPAGLFGIAQRDGGIEVMLDGKTVWTSNEIADDEIGWEVDRAASGDRLRAFVGGFELIVCRDGSWCVRAQACVAHGIESTQEKAAKRVVAVYRAMRGE